jgi:hypothetical protein
LMKRNGRWTERLEPIKDWAKGTALEGAQEWLYVHFQEEKRMVSRFGYSSSCLHSLNIDTHPSLSFGSLFFWPKLSPFVRRTSRIRHTSTSWNPSPSMSSSHTITTAPPGSTLTAA